MSGSSAVDRVSVIVPTWRRRVWLERCLSALMEQERQPDEVIVVGRAEDSGAQEAVAGLGKRSAFPIRWVEVGRPGHVAPVRRGLEESSGDFALFLDDDGEPEKGWLAALLEVLADPHVACAGGKVLAEGPPGKVRADAGQVRWYGRHSANVGSLEAESPLTVDGVMEGNWGWRADVLRALAFDPVLDYDDASMYGLDLCLQARARGHAVVYQPRARIFHHAASRDPLLARGDRVARTSTYSRNYTYVALKHLKGARRVAFLAWWWLLGERGSYGVVTGAADWVLRGDGVGRLVAASFKGKKAGVKAWWANRR